MYSNETRSFNVPSTSSHAYAPPMTAVNLHNLHGCTINTNYTPQPAPPLPVIQGTTTTTEAEYDVFKDMLTLDTHPISV